MRIHPRLSARMAIKLTPQVCRDELASRLPLPTGPARAVPTALPPCIALTRRLVHILPALPATDEVQRASRILQTRSRYCRSGFGRSDSLPFADSTMAKPTPRSSDDRDLSTNAVRSVPIATPAAAGLGAPSRRAFVALMGVGLLTGCAQQAVSRALPGPVWPDGAADDPIASPPPKPVQVAPTTTMPGVLARGSWAKDRPVPSLMNRMLPVRYITIHHDGMTPFFSADTGSTGARLEAIRRSHRNNGWGDIGYHFAIDRDGRIWQGRDLAWQGAHVKDHNEGNVGIVCLGNFDIQSPSPKQVAALQQHVARLVKQYRVPAARVLTHQEWPSAATACPGRNLQTCVSSARTAGRFA